MCYVITLTISVKPACFNFLLVLHCTSCPVRCLGLKRTLGICVNYCEVVLHSSYLRSVSSEWLHLRPQCVWAIKWTPPKKKTWTPKCLSFVRVKETVLNSQVGIPMGCFLNFFPRWELWVKTWNVSRQNFLLDTSASCILSIAAKGCYGQLKAEASFSASTVMADQQLDQSLDGEKLCP